jgi:hypothetical protein
VIIKSNFTEFLYVSEVFMAHALLITKSHVSAFTRKDGAFVAAHDDKRVKAAITAAQGDHKPVKRVVDSIKQQNKNAAAGLKDTIASDFSKGDISTGDGADMTYGKFNDHLASMRTQLGNDPAHSEHLKHAQFALHQTSGGGGGSSAPIKEKHAKLYGAALSGKTKIDDDGMVRHAASANKKAASSSGNIGDSERAQYGDHFKDNYGNHHEVLSHIGAEVKTKGGQSFHPTKVHRVK